MRLMKNRSSSWLRRNPVVLAAILRNRDKIALSATRSAPTYPCPTIESFVTTAPLRYPAFRYPFLEVA
jgi:hypothetical protein